MPINSNSTYNQSLKREGRLEESGIASSHTPHLESNKIFFTNYNHYQQNYREKKLVIQLATHTAERCSLAVEPTNKNIWKVVYNKHLKTNIVKSTRTINNLIKECKSSSEEVY